MSERETGDIVQLKLRFREGTRAALAEAAENNGNSLNSEIVARLETSLRTEAAFGDPATVQVLQSIAAEIARVERRTQKSWLSDHTTFAAAYELVSDKLRASCPGPLNRDAVAVAVDASERAFKALDATLSALVDAGVIRRRPSLPRPGLLGQSVPQSQGLLDPYSNDSKEVKELRSVLRLYEYDLLIDPNQSAAEWSLMEGGMPMDEADKVGVRALLFRFPKLFEVSRAAQEARMEAFKPTFEAEEIGRELANRMRSEARPTSLRGVPEKTSLEEGVE